MRNFLLSILLAVLALVTFDQAPVAADGGPEFQIVALDALQMPASGARMEINFQEMTNFYEHMDVVEVAILTHSTKPAFRLQHDKARFVNKTSIGEGRANLM